jgi:hypothetical protein
VLELVVAIKEGRRVGYWWDVVVPPRAAYARPL